MKSKPKTGSKKVVKHRHAWSFYEDGCNRCGYTERCCKSCSVCQGSEDNKKWIVISS